MKRTHYCGALRKEHIGHSAICGGWVQTKRDMGGVIFLDLMDREGVLQVVFDAGNLTEQDFLAAQEVKNQSVVMVRGLIRLRDEETYNPRLETGEVELKAESFRVVSASKPLPFSLDENAHVREELRLQYRYLDIRRPAMQRALRMRHLVQKAAEDYLDGQGFLNVETPILTKSTPEGARDFLVPSRAHPGTFYALPQSPQIFKQLLMVGGVDKYYQIARCFRDEDLRKDRQSEFTQVDMEMSFVGQEDILVHLEKLFKHLFKAAMCEPLGEAFPRMTWRKAMDTYGTDKPDVRFGLPIVDITDIAEQSTFSVFKKAAQAGGMVRAINVKGKAQAITRSMIDELTKKAMDCGAKGMAWILIHEDGEVNSILPKYFSQPLWDALLARLEAGPGDFILFCGDDFQTVCKTLGALRLYLGDLFDMRPKDQFAFLFVTDFPQFEYSQEEGRFIAMHHPFTMPYEEDLPYLLSDPGRVRSQAYDVVLNGVELGSGSIRIHDSDVQQLMFKALGFTAGEATNRFGFMIDAFGYGTPPHGGFAFGLDRLVMLLLGADSLREVIAFPKTSQAQCLMTQAPDYVAKAQLDLLQLGVAAGKLGPPKAAEKPKIQVAQVAKLAKLRLSDEEQRQLGEDLNQIIAFAGQLGQLDTQDVPITAHVVPLQNVFRPDVPGDSWPRPALLENAPTQENGFFTVPRAVD